MNNISKIFFILSFSCFLVLSAQDLTNSAKIEATRILKNYTNCLNLLSDSAAAPALKKSGMVTLLPDFYTIDVPTFNDMDSIGTGYLPIKDYIKKYREEIKNTVIKCDITTVSKPELNFMRNTYDFKITVLKSIVNKTYRYQQVDSLIKIDTIVKERTVQLTFFVRFDKELNQIKNPQIYSISKQGENQFLPLPEYTAWWVTLTPQWKEIFIKKNNMAELPSENDLKNLPYIFELNLAGTNISDISPLEKITELRKLDLSNTAVSSLAPIANLKFMGELNINKTKVRDLEPIKNLKSLRKLYVNSNELTNIDAVQNLVKLTDFECVENLLKTIDSVKGLVNMEKFNCSLNEITNVNAVKDLIKITDLRFGKNQVESLDPLRNMIDLVRLDIFNNKITNLAPISNNYKIAFLYIDFNPITTLEPISKMGYITKLSLSHTLVKDLSPIKNFNVVRELNIAGTEISSLDPVKKYSYISEFKMYHTNISKGEAAGYKKTHPNCAITYY